MNTKYTLFSTIIENGNSHYLDGMVCKSIRESKQVVKELQPKTASIMNKRGERIHEYTEGEGWKRVNISKRNHCLLMTVGYNWKTRKPITVPYNQY